MRALLSCFLGGNDQNSNMCEDAVNNCTYLFFFVEVVFIAARASFDSFGNFRRLCPILVTEWITTESHPLNNDTKNKKKVPETR